MARGAEPKQGEKDTQAGKGIRAMHDWLSTATELWKLVFSEQGITKMNKRKLE